MTDQEIRQALHQAVDRRLSGVREDPFLAQRVMAAKKGEKPMKKKLSVSLALVLALILMASVALAAGLGLFEKLANGNTTDLDKQRLQELNSISENLNKVITTEDGITIEIDQCYYEGNRVFVSYRESGKLYECIRHEGAPEGDIQWDWTEKNFIAAENMMSVSPAQQEDILWLNGKGQRWEERFDASLHDGLMLADGTYLEIIGGDITVQEDGSIIGWKECEVPPGKRDETLEIKAVLFRTRSIHYQNGPDYSVSNTRGETTDILFTVTRNDSLTYLSGTFMNDVYAVAADFTAGCIKGEIRLSCPEEWVKAHDDWAYNSNEDLIEEYRLYAGNAPLENGGPEWERYEDHMIFFGLTYSRPEILEGLRLVPIYTQSGPRMQEAIPLVKPVNN